MAQTLTSTWRTSTVKWSSKFTQLAAIDLGEQVKVAVGCERAEKGARVERIQSLLQDPAVRMS